MVLVTASLITLLVAIVALIQYIRVKRVEQENEEIRQNVDALESYFRRSWRTMSWCGATGMTWPGTSGCWKR